MMARLYKCRSGLVVNLDKIELIVLAPADSEAEQTWARIFFERMDLKITKAEYEEIVAKCERYVS
jgi:hypothetical protein